MNISSRTVLWPLWPRRPLQVNGGAGQEPLPVPQNQPGGAGGGAMAEEVPRPGQQVSLSEQVDLLSWPYLRLLHFHLTCLSGHWDPEWKYYTGFVRSWKTWKSHGVCKMVISRPGKVMEMLLCSFTQGFK